MAFLKKKNNARSTLTEAISASDIVLIVTDASVFPDTPEFVLTIWNKSRFPDPSDDSTTEIIKVTNINGNILTIERGQEDTSPRSHSSGHSIELLITAGQLKEISDAIGPTTSIQTPVEVPSGTKNGVNKTFTTSVDYVAGSLSVSKNGSTLSPSGIDYTEINSTTFQLVSAPVSDDNLVVRFLAQ